MKKIRDAPIVSAIFSGIDIGLSNFVVFWPIQMLIFIVIGKGQHEYRNLAV